MLSILLLCLVLWSGTCLPAVIPANNSTIATTGWRAEPSSRGTFRLLFSCITALSTCVYTAVHLNIPQQGTTKRARLGRKLYWVILGILAPELVVYTAWAQWHSARNLSREINEMLKRKDADADQGTPQTFWKTTHGFYAGMGGFVIDTHHADQTAFITGSPRLTITGRGIQFLALNNVIPEISEAEIRDKSKANAFAKAFTCVQGSWLIIECTARLAQKLPITLLEINTTGHILCALLMYVFWWSKPLDIEEPMVLRGERLPKMCALMWTASRISKANTNKARKAYEVIELESLTFNSRALDHHAGICTPDQDRNINDAQNQRIQTKSVAIPKPPETVSLAFGETQLLLHQDQVLDGTGFGLNPKSLRFVSSARRPKYQVYSGRITGLQRVVELTNIDIERWKLASETLTENQSLLDVESFEDGGSPMNGFMNWKFKELVCLRAPDWPGSTFANRTKLIFGGRDISNRFNFLSLGLSVTTAVYGGLHIAAWNGYFPTVSERSWWRGSSIAVAVSGTAFNLTMMSGYFFDKGKLQGHFFLMTIYVEFIFIVIMGLAITFAVSRRFLVVEAFVSLRKLPIGAYDTPHWIQDIPHL